MSDLLNKASLVVIPSGYKEDTVYSAVPTDGSGDLSFTRASNGTRINSAGLVEVTPWNLLQYSEDFSNAVWTTYQSSITSNSTIAPNGTNTADSLIDNTNNDQHLIQQGIATSAGIHTISVYAKSNTLSYAWVKYFDGTSAQESGIYNLSNATVSGSGSIESVGNGWCRLSLQVTTLANTGYFYVLTSDGTNKFYAGTGKSIYIWGYQINIGSTAKPYFPTTDRLNVPRLTYQNGGGGCPSLLLEKQSTNLVQYSENLAASSWTTSDNTRTANYATSPDGTQNATRIIPNTNNVAHPTYQVIVVSAATSITAYAKADGYNFFQIYGGEASGVSGSSARFSVVVNLSTFAVDTIDTISSSQVNISNMGNGWAKITINNFTQFTSGNYFLAVAAIPSSGLSRNSVLDIGFAGNGASGVLTYGIQVEQSSYPTSYIPTTSASATRVADACYKTGISSLIGSSEGVLFVDVNFINTGDVQIFCEVSNGGANRVLIYASTTTIICYANATVFSYTQSTNERLKIAFAYKSGDSAFYVNGVQKAVSSSSLTYSGLSQLNIGSNYINDQPTNSPTNQAILFKTRLTNAELASITTL